MFHFFPSLLDSNLSGEISRRHELGFQPFAAPGAIATGVNARFDRVEKQEPTERRIHAVLYEAIGIAGCLRKSFEQGLPSVVISHHQVNRHLEPL